MHVAAAEHDPVNVPVLIRINRHIRPQFAFQVLPFKLRELLILDPVIEMVVGLAAFAVHEVLQRAQPALRPNPLRGQVVNGHKF